MTQTELQKNLEEISGKSFTDLSEQEIYHALMLEVKKLTKERGYNYGERKLYYFSAEFLIGKMLSNHLINLGIYDTTKALLKEKGIELSYIEEVESEPSLGNGGLGRLAACFLDSIATLGLYGDGIGLNYHYGLFQQKFENRLQKEEKNPWLTKDCWLEKTSRTYRVAFGKGTVTSTLYDMTISGYEGKSNHLHLFDLESIDESLVKEGITFDKEAITGNLTLFLYPDDSDRAGNLLRIYQQYFMVSSGAQLILDEMKEAGYALSTLSQHVVIQINDTHPSLVIPELIRLLRAEGMSMDEAIACVSRTCAYTNHTILAEALEKWPVSYLEEVVPQLLPIIYELDKRAKKQYPKEELAIVDANDRVHMARMDIHYGFSVNGVAALHTEILKKSELHAFYEIYPEKFNNKTNGITFRRWLMHCNPALCSLLDHTIGTGYRKDANELKELLKYSNNTTILNQLQVIKQQNKTALKQVLLEKEQIVINDHSIYDIQVKRLHEYKRQQLNALYIIYKYLEIKKGRIPTTPITMIFGAKAAPAYTIAKDIIHLLLVLQTLIQNDPEVAPYLSVVMVENYNVTYAEQLIPACDISEQISLASKEASGTGNMKFMLNGAVTLGTEDGANVEIHELVGDENIFVFGDSSDTVISRYEKGDYCSLDYYLKDDRIKNLMDFMVGREMLSLGNPESLLRLHREMLIKDWFMTFPDLDAYIETKERAYAAYENTEEWNRKSLVNIAMAGYFSSDRTIEQYNQDIWKLSK